jgi:hypothetical protein
MRKTRDILFTLGFSLLLPVIAALTLFHRTGETLYYENRYKAEAPTLSAAGLLDGSYFSGLETYLTDHAPLRITLLSWQTRMEMYFLRLPLVNDVVVTDEALLPYKDYEIWDLYYMPLRCSWVGDDNRALADIVEGYGGSYFYLGLPEKFSYYSSRYPSYMNNRQWYLEPATAEFKKALAERGVDFLDMAEVFDAMGHPLDLYYRSDHHFNLEGALVCYHTLMDAIRQKTGLQLPELAEGENLELITLQNHFVGSMDRKLYDLWESGDMLAIGQPKESVAFTREDEGRTSEPTIYELPESPDDNVDYDVYMGGDKAETVIRTNRPVLPSILIFGDSYTNVLESLLYWSFDEMRSVDLRYYDEMLLSDYIQLYKPDIVVCVRDDTNYCELDGNGNLLGIVR